MTSGSPAADVSKGMHMHRLLFWRVIAQGCMWIYACLSAPQTSRVCCAPYTSTNTCSAVAGQCALEWKHIVCQNTCITFVSNGKNVKVIRLIRTLITTRSAREGEHVVHATCNWLQNIALTISVFLFPADIYQVLQEELWKHRFMCFSLCLSLHMLQDVGVLPQPADSQLFSSKDGSRAETAESHQQSAKWVQNPQAWLMSAPLTDSGHIHQRSVLQHQHVSFPSWDEYKF